MYTHAYNDDLVVFNIGMIIHKPLRADLWGPVSQAMPRMLRELGKAKAAAERGEGPDLGFLGAVTLVGRSGPWVTQYWRSPEDLYAYAHATDLAHLPAWRAFNKAARRAPDAVGIWHETFVVPAANVETIYSSPAGVGLGRFGGTVEVRRRGRSARERLGSTLTSDAPAAPSHS